MNRRRSIDKSTEPAFYLRVGVRMCAGAERDQQCFAAPTRAQHEFSYKLEIEEQQV